MSQYSNYAHPNTDLNALLVRQMAYYAEENKASKQMVETSVSISARLLTEVEQQSASIHALRQDMVEMRALIQSQLAPRLVETPTVTPPSHFEPIPSIPTSKGPDGKRTKKAFTQAVLEIIREKWLPAPKTLKEVGAAYVALYDWAGELVRDLGEASYKPNPNMKENRSLKNLPSTTLSILINRLTAFANTRGLFIGQCKKDWLARSLLAIQIKSQRRRKDPQAPCNNNGGDNGQSDDNIQL